MMNTIGAIVLVGATLAIPFAVTLVAVAAGDVGFAGAHSVAEGDYTHDYPTNLWADH